MDEQTKKITDETMKLSMELVSNHMESSLTLLKMFKTLALEKAKQENGQVVVADDVIKMLGVKLRRKKNNKWTFPLDRNMLDAWQESIESMKERMSRIEWPKKE